MIVTDFGRVTGLLTRRSSRTADRKKTAKREDPNLIWIIVIAMMGLTWAVYPRAERLVSSMDFTDDFVSSQHHGHIISTMFEMSASRLPEPQSRERSFLLHYWNFLLHCLNDRLLSSCSLRTESGGPANCEEGVEEKTLMQKYISPNATVLELGARYGGVSVLLAHLLHNSGRLVSAEPDRSVQAALHLNQLRHRSSFHILAGTVGKEPVKLNPGYFGGYTTQSELASFGDKDVVPTIEWKTLEKEVGLVFDTLVIDCEGCGTFFIPEHREIISSQIKTIILELDLALEDVDGTPCIWQIPGLDYVDYKPTLQMIEEMGFVSVEKDIDGAVPCVSYQVFTKVL